MHKFYYENCPLNPNIINYTVLAECFISEIVSCPKMCWLFLKEQIMSTFALSGFLHPAKIYFGGDASFRKPWTNPKPIPLFAPVIRTDFGHSIFPMFVYICPVNYGA